MLSRNKTYSLAENLYHEAKLQLEKQIFVPKQLKSPHKHKTNKLCCYQNLEMEFQIKPRLWNITTFLYTMWF